MYRHLRSVLILLLCVCCVEPYTPSIDPVSLNSLVVDGAIDASGSAVVKLSRALPLTSHGDAPLEQGAIVTISSSTGEVFNLTEKQPAIYSADNLSVSKQAIYRLRIQIAGGREYESDEVQIHPTPPVGRVYFTYSPSGDDVEVRTDSRDTNPNSTGYYLWESIETFEYKSAFFSRFKRVGSHPVLRTPSEFVDTCWREQRMPTVITSTTRLSENVISGKVLTTINKTSPKISMRYSILVRQRSISEQEYNYRDLLSKTSDLQGSIFAQIPGPVVSNVHSTTDPDEYVLGYFRGQEIKQARMFIGHRDLPEQFQIEFEEVGCDLEAACPTNSPIGGPNLCIDIELLSDSKIVITSTEFRNSVIYIFAPVECGDCRIKGGVTTMPDYW